MQRDILLVLPIYCFMFRAVLTSGLALLELVPLCHMETLSGV